MAAIRRESDALLEAAAKDLTADVPTCPGWTVTRLVGHQAKVYDWIAGWIMTGESVRAQSAPKDETVLDYTIEVRDKLVTLLADLGQHGTAPTWLGEQPVTFWPRRMAMETAIHRWDAENAVGSAAPVPPELAVDGVDEMLQVLVPNRLADELRALEAAGASIHLHATDVDAPRVGDQAGEWLVTLGPDGGMTVQHEHGKGDVAVRGTASDLFLFVWNRVEPDQLEVFGDTGLLDRWRSLIRI